MIVLDGHGPYGLEQTVPLRDATADFLDQAGLVVSEYSAPLRTGTPPALAR